MPRAGVAVRRPADDDVAILEQECGALILETRTKAEGRAGAVCGGSRHARLDVGWAAEFLGRRRNVDRV